MEADKTADTYDHKQKAKAQVGDARTEAQKSFVQTVAVALGRDPDQIQFDADGLSPELTKKGAAPQSATLLHRPSVRWQRDLALDLDVLEKWHAAVVVTLVEKLELALLEVPHLGEAIAERHIDWLHLLIADRGVGVQRVYCFPSSGRAEMEKGGLEIEFE